jgi:hypothetical protein
MNFQNLLIFFLTFQCAFAQEVQIPKDYFRSPVDIKLMLSGTFAEPRNTHFHAGIDIKTEGLEGKNIYAVADGYISRIGVSPTGYGNALYITHPNGLVSVYGHLQKFSYKIQDWVKQQQHLNKNFALQLENLDPTWFPVSKGEVIAFSGNTGGSGGPHLHFEIRDSLEHALNPLNYGFAEMIIDNARPSIYNLHFYTLDLNKTFTPSKYVSISDQGSGKYQILTPIKVNTQELGIGVHTVDLFTGTSHKNGIYQIKMFVDEILTYQYQANTLSFNYQKHVFSHCDFLEKKNGNSLHKCFVEKGNKINNYPVLQNQGKIYLEDGNVKNVRIEVSDYHGNISQVSCQVLYSNESNYFIKQAQEYLVWFDCKEKNQFNNDFIKLNFPDEVLFEDLYFNCTEKSKNAWGPVVEIHNKKTPLAKYYDVAIKHGKLIEGKEDKYLLAYYDFYGNKKPLGGNINDGYIEGKSRDFGTHFIDIDTMPPVITFVNIAENKIMSNQKYIQLKASDNFSGIKEYNAFINGNWVVLEYDAKRALFTYYFDELCSKGNNEFTVVISDERANAKTKKVNFIY